MSAEGKDFYRVWRDLSAPYFDWQVEQFRPWLGRRIADVGCGPGTLTPFLSDREFYLAVDNDPRMLAMLRERYGASVACLEGGITDPACRDQLRAARIDTVVSSNTIEHIEDDRQALRMMVEALPQGGHLCLLVPAFQQLYGTLDKLDGHFRRYTKASLRERCEGLPVQWRHVQYFNMVGALGWWLKGRVLKEAEQKAENYRAMTILLPIVRPLERIVPSPFGLSLIVVLERL